MWGDAKMKHQAMMHKRQGILAAAWEKHMAAAGDASDDDFSKGWMKARSDALEAAGMSVPFPTW